MQSYSIMTVGIWDSLLAKFRAEFRKVSLGSNTPLSNGEDSAIYSAGIQGGLQVIKSNYMGILSSLLIKIALP